MRGSSWPQAAPLWFATPLIVHFDFSSELGRDCNIITLLCACLCGCVGFCHCNVLQIRKEWLMPPEPFADCAVTGIGRGREATQKLPREAICCKSSQRKIWNPPTPAMEIFRGPCPVSRSPRGCNSRSLELIGNIFAKLPCCDH